MAKTQTRHTTIFLLLGLLAFLALQQLGGVPDEYAGSGPTLAILGVAAMLSVIAVPALGRMAVRVLVLLSSIAYLLIRLVGAGERPLWGGVEVYVSIAEVSLLAGLVWLAHRLASALGDFEQAVEQLALGDLGRSVRSFNAEADDVRSQMLLSRRYERPLSVLFVTPEPGSMERVHNRTLEEVQQAIAKRQRTASLSRTFASVLRRSDLLMSEGDQGSFVILCPETDTLGSSDLAERLKAAARQALGISLQCGTASFPSDALILDDLVEKARTAAVRSADVVELSTMRSASVFRQLLGTPERATKQVADETG